MTGFYDRTPEQRSLAGKKGGQKAKEKSLKMIAQAKKLREENPDMLQKEIAEILGVTQAAVSNYLKQKQ